MARRKKGDPVSGWICLDKPYEMGSTQAVGAVRRAFNAQKAGHAGTLDPLATGILPVALGEATKTVSFLQDAKKGYRFTIRWGQTTRTLDAEGEIIARSDVRPTSEAIEAALPALTGEIEQVPPAFSAILVDGERAYDLARAGEDVELKARPVVVHDLRLVERPDADHAVLSMICGKGTYMRALVRDLAGALSAEAHVAQLRRTFVGPFSEDRAISLEMLQDLVHRGRAQEAMLPVETALDDIPALASRMKTPSGSAGARRCSAPQASRGRQGVAERRLRTVLAMHRGKAGRDLAEMRAGQIRPVREFQP